MLSRLRICIRPRQRNHIIPRRHARRPRYGRVEAQHLLDEHVEVRQRVELVEAGSVRIQSAQVMAQARLYCEVLGELVNGPCGRGRSRLVSGDEEGGDLWQTNVSSILNSRNGDKTRTCKNVLI